EDRDRGEVVNTATATGNRTDNGEQVVSNEDTVTVPVQRPQASLRLTKRLAAQEEDLLRYEFVVTNSGQVAVDSLAINDSAAQSLSCPETTLQPGQTVVCTGEHEITQEDRDRGEIVNVATAAGNRTDNGQQVVSNESKLVVRLDRPDASLKLTKRLARHDKHDKHGKKVLRYEFVVTNTGQVAVDSLAINDPVAQSLTCPAGTLQPGQTVVCTGQHTITPEDKKHGKVVNTATATGKRTDNGQQVVSNKSTLTVLIHCKKAKWYCEKSVHTAPQSRGAPQAA
ncbi:hypothetical protein ACFQ07_25880, partial [Actinomadura adrarensis]